MAASVVQSKLIRSSPGSAPNAALDSSVTAGNALIVLVSYFSSGTDGAITVSDNRGNTWTTRVAAQTGNGQSRIAICEALNVAGGATTITVTSSGTGDQYITADAVEVASLPAASAFDVSATNTGASTTPSTGTTAATAQADEIAFAVFGTESSGGMATPTDYTNLDLNNDNSVYQPISACYRILTATGAQSASFTAGMVSWVGGIATYKAAAGGGGGTVTTQTLTSSATVTDQTLRSALRNAMLSSLLSVTEGGTLRFTESNLIADDSIDVADQGAQFATRGRVATDTIDLTDGALWWMLRHRLLQEGISVSDDFLSSITGNNVLTRVLTSEILLTDEALPRFYRNRLLESDLDVVDEATLWMLRYRLAESGISLTDGTLSQVIGGNILFKVLTSDVVMADELLAALLVSRQLSDSVETDDGLLTAMQRFILLTDALSVDDSAVSQFVPDAVFAPRIVIGTNQPNIELGMDPVCITLGMDPPHMVLGGSVH